MARVCLKGRAQCHTMCKGLCQRRQPASKSVVATRRRGPQEAQRSDFLACRPSQAGHANPGRAHRARMQALQVLQSGSTCPGGATFAPALLLPPPSHDCRWSHVRSHEQRTLPKLMYISQVRYTSSTQYAVKCCLRGLCWMEGGSIEACGDA